MALGVGEFTRNRMTVRSEVNPMDKATVVSIFPMEIEERKVTIEPGHFVIPAGSVDKPSVLTIGTSSWWRDIDPEQPLLEIVVGSVRVANSVVTDYCNAMLCFKSGIAQPGLFYVPGAHTSESIKKNFAEHLAQAEEKQRNWYMALVQMGDVLWARTNGNPLVIADLMRRAARELNMENKEWLANYQAAELARCRACGFLINPAYPICSNCKAITNDALAKELNIKFAS